MRFGRCWVPERYPPFIARVVVPVFETIFSNWTRLLTLRLNPLSVKSSGLVPREGGLIILSNHLADIDPIMIQWACPRPIHFMGKQELFDMKVIGYFMRLFQSFPIKRNTADRNAIKTAIALAKMGEVVAMFPEGELSETGELRPLLPGAALIIRQAGVLAICCHLEGTNSILPYGKTSPVFNPGAKLSARWSEPRDLSGFSNEDIMEWVKANIGPDTDS
ncbi:1-acyl-sn-glycerol-3-phosphate acyltransferase [bacterium]|nr:MAG: 1-acyl-sn-glycerol-3-phosphate acyltransferase [bacterium]